MNPWYRRMQIIFTGIVLIPSVILLIFTYLAATTPSHSATEAVILFIIALALPPLIYGLWEGIIWLKRGQSPDADPKSLAARVGRNPYVAFVPVTIVVTLAYFLSGLSESLDHHKAKSDTFVDMRQSCESESAKSAKQAGADPTSAVMKTRISKYCGCFVLQMQMQYNPDEIEKVAAGGPAGFANDKKFNSLIDRCTKEAVEQ